MLLASPSPNLLLEKEGRIIQLPVAFLASTRNTSTSPLNTPSDKMSRYSNGLLCLSMASPPSSCDEKGNGSTSSITGFQFLLLFFMVLQNSLVVLVGRFTRSSIPDSERYDINHFLLMSELTKLLASMMLELHRTSGGMLKPFKQVIFQTPLDTLKMAVPSLLYLVQNTLLFTALENLNAPVFQVINQSKLVTTALLSVVVLNRNYSAQQWFCLVGVCLGVVVVILDQRKEDGSDEKKDANPISGVTAVTLASFCSAFAGVYFEKVLKTPSEEDSFVRRPSLWMRNIQMATFSLLFALAQSCLRITVNESSYLHGFNGWTWLLIVLQAGGGLLVAAVVKYADNVLKGLGVGVSVILSSGLSMLIFETPLGLHFCIGSTFILASVYIFGNPVTSSPLQISALRKTLTFASSFGNRTRMQTLMIATIVVTGMTLYWVPKTAQLSKGYTSSAGLLSLLPEQQPPVYTLHNTVDGSP